MIRRAHVLVSLVLGCAHVGADDRTELTVAHAQSGQVILEEKARGLMFDLTPRGAVRLQGGLVGVGAVHVKHTGARTCVHGEVASIALDGGAEATTRLSGCFSLSAASQLCFETGACRHFDDACVATPTESTCESSP